MTTQTMARRPKRECKMAFQVERRRHFLVVAIKGDASFDQAELVSARLLQIPLDGYSLVVLDLAELTFISSRAIRALFEFGLALRQRGVEVRHANVQAQSLSAGKPRTSRRPWCVPHAFLHELGPVQRRQQPRRDVPVPLLRGFMRVTGLCRHPKEVFERDEQMKQGGR